MPFDKETGYPALHFCPNCLTPDKAIYMYNKWGIPYNPDYEGVS
jgi:hypothetical protein